MAELRSPRRNAALYVVLGLIFAASGSQRAAGQTDRPGDTFQDCEACPSMVVIPAGRFVMGSPADETDRDDDESPQHTVVFAADFALSRFEITRGQYRAFVEATGHASGASCSVWAETQWQEQSGRSWTDPAFAQDDTHPAVCVNWHEAKAYVAWLARATGRPYRLPSEAEWEYAARAGTATPYFFGADPDRLCGA